MKTIYNKHRRTFSLILALIMVLSCNMVAFAANADEEYGYADITSATANTTIFSASGASASQWGVTGKMTIPQGYNGLYLTNTGTGAIGVMLYCPALGFEKSYQISKASATFPASLGNDLPAGDYDVLIWFDNFGIGRPYAINIYYN